jgi:hypothetical protein
LKAASAAPSVSVGAMPSCVPARGPSGSSGEARSTAMWIGLAVGTTSCPFDHAGTAPGYKAITREVRLVVPLRAPGANAVGALVGSCLA